MDIYLLEILSAERLLSVLLNHHSVSAAAEIAVVILTVFYRWRGARAVPAGILIRLRPREPEADLSGWWALPLYLWCLETLFVVEDLYFGPRGLANPHPSYYYSIYYYEMATLVILAVTQHLGVLAVGGPALSLGLRGRTRSAVHYALIDVILLGFLFFGLERVLQLDGM